MRRFLGIAVLVSPLALLVAIAVPNMWTAQQRSMQRRTMADIRSLATALEARATDLDTYAIGTARVCANSCAFGSMTRVPLDEVERTLSPTYIRKLPRLDGWGNEFEVRVSAKSYAIRSRGSDDRFEVKTYDAPRTIASFEEDIVFSDGNFVQYPEGT
jgi:type II secretory pathway pseudopilin PulG